MCHPPGGALPLLNGFFSSPFGQRVRQHTIAGELLDLVLARCPNAFHSLACPYEGTCGAISGRCCREATQWAGSSLFPRRIERDSNDRRLYENALILIDKKAMASRRVDDPLLINKGSPIRCPNADAYKFEASWQVPPRAATPAGRSQRSCRSEKSRRSIELAMAACPAGLGWRWSPES